MKNGVAVDCPVTGKQIRMQCLEGRKQVLILITLCVVQSEFKRESKAGKDNKKPLGTGEFGADISNGSFAHR